MKIRRSRAAATAGKCINLWVAFCNNPVQRLTVLDSLIQYTCDTKVNTETGALSVTRCNCTFCQKLSFTNLRLGDASNFRLLNPSTKDDLGNYVAGVKTIDRFFCRTCGVHVWCEGFFELAGQKHDLFIVNLATVDQPQGDVDLSLTKIAYWDMLRDNFQAGPRDSPYPNGLV